MPIATELQKQKPTDLERRKEKLTRGGKGDTLDSASIRLLNSSTVYSFLKQCMTLQNQLNIFYSLLLLCTSYIVPIIQSRYAFTATLF